MIPILFDASASDFTTNGIGRLVDAISCSVVEERNGEYELEMVYPISGELFSQLSYSSIIVAKVSGTANRLQAFRIYKISRPILGRCTYYARHISYQLSHIPCVPFSAGSLASALSGFNTNAVENNPFTITADWTSSASFAMPLPSSVRSYLGGRRGSIIDVYGGEYEWDNYNVYLHQHRGSNNGVVLRYGKNIVDLTQEQNIENTVTGVLCYWYQSGQNESSDGGGATSTMVNMTTPVHSANANLYPYNRTITLDVTDKFQSVPTVADLTNYANAYVQTSGIGIPNVSIDVDFVNLADTETYKDIAQLETVSLCDTITVEFSKLGVSTTAKVIKTEWDVLAERYIKIHVGDSRSTLADTIEDNIESIEARPTYDEAQSKIDRATGVLNSGLGGHVVINRNADGWANEILFMDTENTATAQQVLRINENGIGFSSAGYSGPYYQSWTIDGHFALGGVNNAYGDFEILDSNGNALGEWDKDGLKLYDSAQHMILAINNGGLFLYNTSGGTLAQMTPSGLNVYKGVIQGTEIKVGGGTGSDGVFTVYDASGNEIGHWDKDGIELTKGKIDIKRGSDIGLYCDGSLVQIGDFEVNDAYGRQILQSSDEKTGISGEPDQASGLYLWTGYEDADTWKFVVNTHDAYVQKNGTSYPIWATLDDLLERVSDLENASSSSSSSDSSSSSSGNESSSSSDSSSSGETPTGDSSDPILGDG